MSSNLQVFFFFFIVECNGVFFPQANPFMHCSYIHFGHCFIYLFSKSSSDIKCKKKKESNERSQTERHYTSVAKNKPYQQISSINKPQDIRLLEANNSPTKIVHVYKLKCIEACTLVVLLKTDDTEKQNDGVR